MMSLRSVYLLVAFTYLCYNFVIFTDVDECEGENGCHANATCTNTPGTYNCTCDIKFTGNGFDCEGTCVRLSIFIGACT